jgi:hypothetical protein
VTDCERFGDALYDEDARRALATGQPLPPALAAHAGECAACRRLADEVRQDLGLLSRALDGPAPPRLNATVLAAMRRVLPPREVALVDWRPAATWAASAGALAVCTLILSGVALPWVWQVVAVLAAAAAALSTEITLQALDTSCI